MKIVCEQRCDEGIRYFKDNVCGTIRTIDGGGDKRVMNLNDSKIRIRKLTPKECWRLMGFRDIDYERARAGMNENCYHGKDRSQSQLYKQAGNSIVVDVLYYIMANLKSAMPYLFEDMTVGSFFSGIGAFEVALSRLDDDGVAASGNQIENTELTQVGYINGYNGDANRVYDGTAVSRTLKAEAGGGGAKTGWYQLKS